MKLSRATEAFLLAIAIYTGAALGVFVAARGV